MNRLSKQGRQTQSSARRVEKITSSRRTSARKRVRGGGSWYDANNASPSPSRREERYRLRDELATFTTLERVRKCGRCAHGPTITVRANADGSRPGFTGLTTCGSVWACPRCAAIISTKRAAELTTLLERADADGQTVAMLTLTMRHHKGQGLKKLWDGLSLGWRAATSGKAWKEDREQARLAGYIRATEVTSGRNGWHVHIHCLLIGAGDLNVLADGLFNRWNNGLARHGFESVKDSGGFNLTFAEKGDSEALGKYVAKMGNFSSDLAAEATLGGFKQARMGNRTPFQLLNDITTNGDCDDLALWWEYEQASKGKRALTFSRGLRDRYGLEKEKTDEELAQEAEGDTEIVSIDAADWKKVLPYAALLLDACEQEGPQGVINILKIIEVNYRQLC